jgi:hypothetical protein
MNLEYFCKAVFAICKLYGGSVTSWIRSREHNEKVGGLQRSFHVLGLAVDIVLDDSTPERIHSVIDYASQYHLQVIDEKSHLHIEPAPGAFPGKGGPQDAIRNGNA